MTNQPTTMKILKLSILKNQRSQLNFYSLIKIEVNCKIAENYIELGNIMRRKLLKDTIWLKYQYLKGKNPKNGT